MSDNVLWFALVISIVALIVYRALFPRESKQAAPMPSTPRAPTVRSWATFCTMHQKQLKHLKDPHTVLGLKERWSPQEARERLWSVVGEQVADSWEAGSVLRLHVLCFAHEILVLERRIDMLKTQVRECREGQCTSASPYGVEALQAAVAESAKWKSKANALALECSALRHESTEWKNKAHALGVDCSALRNE